MEGTPVRRDAEWQLQAPSTQAAGAPSLYVPNKACCAQSPPLQLPAPRGPRALLSRPSASVSPRSPSHLTRDSGDVLGRVSESEKSNTSLTPALTGAAAITRRHVTRRALGWTLHPSREEPGGAGGLRALRSDQASLGLLLTSVLSMAPATRQSRRRSCTHAPITAHRGVRAITYASFFISPDAGSEPAGAVLPWAGANCQASGLSWWQSRTNGAVTPRGTDHRLTRSRQETRDPGEKTCAMTGVHLKENNKNFRWQFWVREGSRGEIMSFYFPGWCRGRLWVKSPTRQGEVMSLSFSERLSSSGTASWY